MTDDLVYVYRRCPFCEKGVFGDFNHLKVCPKYPKRIVYRVEDLPQEMIEAIRNAKAPEWTHCYDEESETE